MRILIVDDEAPARVRMQRLVEQIDDCRVAGEAAGGVEALKVAGRTEPDVVLLDIRMPDMDGLETAHHLGRLDPPPAIIFVTAFGDHALEAFDTHAVDYLLKPVRRERLARALAGARRPTRAQLAAVEDGKVRSRLTASLGGSLEVVEVAAVRYFQADRKYVTVRHADGELLIEEALTALEQEFGDRFLRIHRNALVAPAHVGGLQRSADGRMRVWFRDIDDTLEVSRRHIAEARRRLQRGT